MLASDSDCVAAILKPMQWVLLLSFSRVTSHSIVAVAVQTIYDLHDEKSAGDIFDAQAT